MRLRVRSLALLSGSGVAVSCSVGRRCGLGLALLWLWCRLVATAPIRPLAWEPPYATGAAYGGKKKRQDGLEGPARDRGELSPEEGVDLQGWELWEGGGGRAAGGEGGGCPGRGFH